MMMSLEVALEVAVLEVDEVDSAIAEGDMVEIDWCYY